MYIHTECGTCRYRRNRWVNLDVGNASRHETTRTYNERLSLLLSFPPSLSLFFRSFFSLLSFCVLRHHSLALERHRTLFRRFYFRGNSKDNGQLLHRPTATIQSDRPTATSRRHDAEAKSLGYGVLNFFVLSFLPLFKAPGPREDFVSRFFLLFSFPFLPFAPRTPSSCFLARNSVKNIALNYDIVTRGYC